MKITIFLLLLSTSAVAFPNQASKAKDEISLAEEDYLFNDPSSRMDIEELVKRQADDEVETPEMPEIPTVPSIPSGDGSTFSEKAAKAWEQAKEKLQSGYEAAKEKLATAYDKAKEAATKAYEAAKKHVATAADKVKDWAASSK
uniref:Uncharacterized protein n=1 Tax=Strigamia maritima TaxID=126957 RepID=T1J1Z3_STRMM